jgi:hypothetical protein
MPAPSEGIRRRVRRTSTQCHGVRAGCQSSSPVTGCGVPPVALTTNAIGTSLSPDHCARILVRSGESAAHAQCPAFPAYDPVGVGPGGVTATARAVLPLMTTNCPCESRFGTLAFTPWGPATVEPDMDLSVSSPGPDAHLLTRTVLSDPRRVLTPGRTVPAFSPVRLRPLIMRACEERAGGEPPASAILRSCPGTAACI